MEAHKYNVVINNSLGVRIVLTHVWVLEDGSIDESNLPPNSEIAEMLQAIRLGRKIELEATGIIDRD